MAFDDKTRRRLFKTVTTCRNLLTDDFDEQLRGRYGIYADEGSVRELDKLTNLDESQRNTAIALRERIEHLSAGGGPDAISTAVHRIRREQAFTILNRLAAVRMAEERKIISQSVGAGLQSTGFRVFEQAAGSALGSQIERYLTYLDCLFDELSLDLGILFDRSDALGLLFPTETALRELFRELNDPEIAPLWAEDETIGWIYQYWNTREEITEMRRHGAPRNSRELAVRNQFFTPRYVVEFLTDNTLGRIWYEMTRGQTRLVEQCRYLVRRPTEVFLDEGEAAPETTEQEGLSQEKLLKQAVHIPHRPIKDPREIRLLDPACGSMHFGLYAFDLLEVIYEESWDNGSFPALQEAYASKDEFLKDVPRLIIEHNIHGVDIDPRATQIAGLSLWLRAQKAWQAHGVKPIDRPRVRRSNIVCAEPMPGSHEMLEEFVATLDPPLLGELVQTVFDKMQLAGEAGTLLKIEEEIRGAIDTARKAWEKLEAKPRELFSTEELNKTTSAPEFTGLEKALTSGHQPLTTDFFDTAEQQVIDALHAYAEQADAASYQRRLFADDAARGFAFIDICRKRYDAVVMNPPFGRATDSVFELMENRYPASYIDIYCCFIEHALHSSPEGMVGAITSRSFLNAVTLENFRTNIVPRTSLIVDLGLGVLDNALVEVAATIFSSSHVAEIQILDAQDCKNKEALVSETLSELNLGFLPANSFLVRKKLLQSVPKKQILYKFGNFTQGHLTTLEPAAATVRAGLNTFDNFRFVRCWWEVDSSLIRKGAKWEFFSKGGEFETYYDKVHLVIQRKDAGRELAAVNMLQNGQVAQSRQSHSKYYVPGLIYTIRSSRGFNARHFPSDCVFSIKGPVIQATADTSLPFLCAYLNCEPIRGLIQQQANANQFMPSIIKSLPWSEPDEELHGAISKLGLDCILAKQRCYVQLEESPRFLQALDGHSGCKSLRSLAEAKKELVAKANDTLHRASQEVSALLTAFLNFPEVNWSAEGISLNDHNISQEFEVAEEASVALRVIGFCLGASFGRWDIRYATGERQSPELPDPFDPLPVSPPGMLQNAEGLPAEPKDVPDDYPLRITWPGILVDDENHPEDIVARVRRAIEVIWKDRADAIEQEACEILGVKAKPRGNLDALRVYFRDPNRFFKDHLARYSKSRRKAPIYWPLSTESGSYTLWIYYHRLDSQTLYTCVRKFIDPKREDLGKEIEALRNQIGNEGSTDDRQKLEDMVAFQQELKVFRDRLIKVADMPYHPNLNDGVLITASPLWECFRHRSWQTNLKKTWTELSKKALYDWAHLAMSMWPERVTPKCASDRSLAIAHGVEDLLWVPDSQSQKADRYRPLLKPEEELKLLEAENSKENIEKATKEYEAAKVLGLHRTLWVEQPEGTWRRRLTPKQEIESEINRRKGR